MPSCQKISNGIDFHISMAKLHSDYAKHKTYAHNMNCSHNDVSATNNIYHKNVNIQPLVHRQLGQPRQLRNRINKKYTNIEKYHCNSHTTKPPHSESFTNNVVTTQAPDSMYDDLKHNVEDGYDYLKDHVEDGYDYLKDHTESGYHYLKDHAESGYDYVKDKTEDGYDYVKSASENHEYIAVAVIVLIILLLIFYYR